MTLDDPQDTRTTRRSTRPRSSAALITAAVWLGIFALVSAATWYAYATLDIRNDEYQLILLGKTVGDGGRLYVDCWENKPPGIAWLNAVGFIISGGWALAPWILPGLAALAALAIVWRAARRLAGLGAAVLTAGTAALLVTLRGYNTPSINPDFYASISDLTAAALMFVALFARSRHPNVIALLSGIAWGAGICFKQTGFIGPTVMSGAWLWLCVTGSAQQRQMWWRGAVMWAGVLLVIGASCAVLALRGNLPQAIDAIWTSNIGLLTPDRITHVFREGSRFAQYQADIWLFVWPGIIALLASLSVHTRLPLPRAIIWGLGLWLVLEAWFAMLGPSRNMRYWQALWPPMVWLLCCGVVCCRTIFERAEFSGRVFCIVSLLTIGVLLGRPLVRTQLGHVYGAIARAQSTARTPRDKLREIGRTVQQHTPLGEHIYVMSYTSGIYLYADRPPAARFTKIGTAAQRDEVLDILSHGGARTLVVPEQFKRSHWAAEQTRVFEEDVLTQYAEVERINGFVVLILDVLAEQEIDTTGTTDR